MPWEAWLTLLVVVWVLVGEVDSVRDLHRLRGLTPATDQVFRLDAPPDQRCLVEAVISPVIAIHAHGKLAHLENGCRPGP